MATKPISLKLLVHKDQNQVVYAESDNDFVDVLFSFLTMPIGTVVRLAGKQSKIGCMSTLYEAVQHFDMKFLQTEACKQMLLHPRNTSGEWCKNLKVNVDDTTPTEYYTCSAEFRAGTHHLASTASTAQCLCGKMMATKFSKSTLKLIGCGEDGVFVKGNVRFMITDDLQISPVSTKASFTVLNKLGISDAAALQERNVNVGAEEVLDLLKHVFLSKTPLTDVFLRCGDAIDGVDLDFKHLLKHLLRSKTPLMDVSLPSGDTTDGVGLELDFKDMSPDYKGKAPSSAGTESGSESKEMKVKLIVSNSNNKVLYAEGGKEFLDLLFSFLAFPLGSVVKVLGRFTGMRCLSNLYESVELLSLNNCIMSEECKDILLDPKIAPYFGCDVQLLQIQEQVPLQLTFFNCRRCSISDCCPQDEGAATCSHGKKMVQLFTINPKYPNVVKEVGGAFTTGPATFMVTEDLDVKPLSPISGISLLNKLGISISDIEERVVNVGEEEALSLLKASLISKTALSDVFISKKPKQSTEGSYKGRPASAKDFSLLCLKHLALFASKLFYGLETLVHKENNQVVYVEGGNDFVDILYSLGTIPTGTVVKLFGNVSKTVCTCFKL